MKKITYMTLAMVFGFALGLANAGNGVTDFTGKTYDVLETALASVPGNVDEGSAAGGVRLTESDNEKFHNGVTDFSGRTYDVLEISAVPSVENVAEGSAAGGPRRNMAGEESSIRTFDALEMTW